MPWNETEKVCIESVSPALTTRRAIRGLFAKFSGLDPRLPTKLSGVNYQPHLPRNKPANANIPPWVAGHTPRPDKS